MRVASGGEQQLSDGVSPKQADLVEGGVCSPPLTHRKYREISSLAKRATGPAGSVRIAGQLIQKKKTDRSQIHFSFYDLGGYERARWS